MLLTVGLEQLGASDPNPKPETLNPPAVWKFWGLGLQGSGVSGLWGLRLRERPQHSGCRGLGFMVLGYVTVHRFPWVA